MTIKFRIYITSLIATALIFSACSNSNGKLQTESSAGAISTPTPYFGKIAQIKADYRATKIADNLKDSIEQQDLPNVWLEFEKENSEIIRIELSNDFKEKLNNAGKALFRYQYVINNSENPDERYDASYNQSVVFVNTLNALRAMEINAPDGKRKLTDEEASRILKKQSGLINDRYYELDDRFKPKSTFYKFKKALNEKLGSSVF